MNYYDLYKFAEATIAKRAEDGKKSVIVPIISLKEKLKAEVTWLQDINFHPVDTKKNDPLGHFECHGDSESQWEQPDEWVALITYDSILNMCEKRFVWCKEMMHIFDTHEGCVKTDAEYRDLLNQIELKPLDPSESYLSENMAKWMALLVLCPKPHRDEIIAQAASEGLSDYDVALKFRIPEAVVPSLFSDYYEKSYDMFVS